VSQAKALAPTLIATRSLLRMWTFGSGAHLGRLPRDTTTRAASATTTTTTKSAIRAIDLLEGSIQDGASDGGTRLHQEG
jgi:hypothetical protein